VRANPISAWFSDGPRKIPRFGDLECWAALFPLSNDSLILRVPTDLDPVPDHIRRVRLRLLCSGYACERRAETILKEVAAPAPITKAVIDAHKREVKVQAILDLNQRREKYSSGDFINNAGITCLIDDAHAIAHNKVMIIDGQIVITGSLILTKAAGQKNGENLLIIEDATRPHKYSTNWSRHAKQVD
jgi:hypothetical protein